MGTPGPNNVHGHGGNYAIAGGDKLARELEQLVNQSIGAERGQAELHNDPEITGHLHQRNFAQGGRIHWGKVVYTLPYAHWYRVALDDLMGDAPCCALTAGSVTPLAVQSNVLYQPDTSVLVWWPPEGLYGFILGAVPDKVEDGGLVFPDWVVQGGNTGFKREAYYRELFELLAADGGITDFSNNRPVDAGVLDWGYHSPLGGGIHIDPFYLSLRMDETCGLELFYLDRLARLSGHQLDLRTAVSELTVRDDSSEAVHYWGSTPYAWEARGAYAPGTTTHRVIENAAVQYTEPHAKYEPVVDNIQAFHRYQEFRGYCGQGVMRQIVAPPVAAQGVNQYQPQSPQFCLFREQVGLDGSLGIATAHSFALVKRTLLAVPKRIRIPEDTTGDTLADDDYKFAGQYGAGPEHVVGDIKTTVTPAALQRAMGMDDFLAHLFEWKGLHAFHYHAKDFSVPTQDEMAPLTAVQTVPSFSALGSQQWLPRPDAKQLHIDHRYGDVDYYETSAGVFGTPDGSLILRGGNVELRLVDGTFQVAAPGDVWIQPGRNFNVWAGHDSVTRARNSVDIVAGTGTIRAKADKDVQVLAGNSGIGGILLESRADAAYYDFKNPGEAANSSGVVLRAPHSDVVAWANNIYLRTGGDTIDSGDIVLDAAKGDRDIRTVSSQFIRHIKSSASDAFPVDGDKTVVNNFSAQNTQLQTPCELGGQLEVLGGIRCDGSVSVVNGHIGTEHAASYGFFVGWLNGKALQDARTELNATAAEMDRLRTDLTTDFETGITQFWYADEKPGNETVIKDAEFSFRTAAQMRTTDLSVPQGHWQQLAELAEQSGTVWTEPPVLFHNEETYPHPGKKRWKEQPAWLKLQLQLHNPKTGRDADRGEAYEDVSFADWDDDGAVLDGNYTVT